MTFDEIKAAFKTLSRQELLALRDEINTLEKAAKEREILTERADIEARLAAKNLTIGDLFGEPKKTKAQKPKAPPKYRDPENPENVWTGRGRAPKWMQGYLAAGRDKSDFLIDG